MQVITSKQHYEMMSAFEKDFKTEGRMDKEPKELWSKGIIYQDGQLNKLFLAFRKGAAYQDAALR